MRYVQDDMGGALVGFPVRTIAMSQDRGDRACTVFMVRSGATSTLRAATWPQWLAESYPSWLRRQWRLALLEHWWRLAHERGGYS